MVCANGNAHGAGDPWSTVVFGHDGAMRSRRVSPVLVWLAIATVCVAVIGGSFVYVSAVGDPLVREEEPPGAPRRR